MEELDRLRDENAKLIAAGNTLRDMTDGYCDKGPTGYGWQSDELKKAFADWDALAKKDSLANTLRQKIADLPEGQKASFYMKHLRVK